MTTVSAGPIKDAKPGSVLLVELGSYRIIGYPHAYPTGLSLVPGENGCPIGSPYPFENLRNSRELTPKVVQPSDVHVGDMVRITNKHGDRIAGFVTRQSEREIYLATGWATAQRHGLPSGHPRNGIDRYEILE